MAFARHNIEKSRLIELVRLNPILWDCRLPHYKRSDKLKTIKWNEVGKTFAVSGERVQRTFTSLREIFRRELNHEKLVGQQYKSKWEYYEAMAFLREVIRERKPRERTKGSAAAGEPPLAGEELPDDQNGGSAGGSGGGGGSASIDEYMFFAPNDPNNAIIERMQQQKLQQEQEQQPEGEDHQAEFRTTSPANHPQTHQLSQTQLQNQQQGDNQSVGDSPMPPNLPSSLFYGIFASQSSNALSTLLTADSPTQLAHSQQHSPQQQQAHHPQQQQQHQQQQTHQRSTQHHQQQQLAVTPTQNGATTRPRSAASICSQRGTVLTLSSCTVSTAGMSTPPSLLLPPPPPPIIHIKEEPIDSADDSTTGHSELTGLSPLLWPSADGRHRPRRAASDVVAAAVGGPRRRIRPLSAQPLVVDRRSRDVDTTDAAALLRGRRPCARADVEDDVDDDDEDIEDDLDEDDGEEDDLDEDDVDEGDEVEMLEDRRTASTPPEHMVDLDDVELMGCMASEIDLTSAGGGEPRPLSVAGSSVDQQQLPPATAARPSDPAKEMLYTKFGDFLAARLNSLSETRANELMNKILMLIAEK